MSANGIHDNGGGSSVKTNKQRREENDRKKLVGKNHPRSSGVGQTGGKRGGSGRVQHASCKDGGGVVQIFTLLSAVGVVILAFAVLIDSIDGLDVCDDDIDGVECYMSSLLFWSVDGVDETENFLNAHWRNVFGFDPATFFDVWTPMIFGVISILQVIKGTKWNLISENWVKAMLWHVVMAIFGCLGFGGQIGLIVGSFVSVTAILCLLAALLKFPGKPYGTLRSCLG